MAKIIESDTQPQSISASYSFWRIALTGLVLGAVYFGLASFFGQSIKSTETAGDIATIVVAVLGILVMLRLYIAQPLIIGIASGATLWGLSQWTSGLSLVEVITWSVLLYGVAYILFSWVTRYIKAVPVLFAVFAVVVAARIASVL